MTSAFSPHAASPPPSPTPTPAVSGGWMHRHVIDSTALTYDDVQEALKTARTFAGILSRPVKKVPTLRGKVVVNMFYENSTRTRTSFELAAKYLSADISNFSVSTSSVKKGESILDTAETLLAMGVDCLVIRHNRAGICQQLARHFGARLALINAGDGAHDHPTQGLLDLYSILQRVPDLCGRKIVIVGDVAHSRVARSNIHLLNLYGAEVHVAGPSTLLPPDIERLGCKAHTQLAPALEGADIVMCLRLQLERQTSGLIPSMGEYAAFYGVTADRVRRYCKPDVLLMHPGPMNRGVEIASDLADDRAVSLITNQVTSGVAIRMALLYLTLATPADRAAFGDNLA